MTYKVNDRLLSIEAEDGCIYAVLESGVREKIANTGTKDDKRTEIKRIRWADGRTIAIPKPLTWQDIKRIVDISDALMEYAEAGIIEEFLASEENFYTEVLKRFNQKQI